MIPGVYYASYMVEQEKPIRFNRHLRLVLEELQKAGGPIYRISSAKGRNLLQMGFLTRPDPRGPYYLTPLVEQTLHDYPAPPPKPKRQNATENLVDHVASLRRRVTHEEVMDLLDADAQRGTDTSPKIMRPKGRRAPRRTGK